jgi:hypothetical protein
VAKTWASASEDNRGDVRELIPELYYSPLMLLNLNHHHFGKKQVTEEDVDDVELPPWALGNALLFTHRLREVSYYYFSVNARLYNAFPYGRHSNQIMCHVTFLPGSTSFSETSNIIKIHSHAITL